VRGPAGRELAEELGVFRVPRLVLKFLCRGEISPYRLGVHEVVVSAALVPDPAEIAWYGWCGEGELLEAVGQGAFVADGVEALRRCLAA
jgi:hypothetical protein